MFDRTDRSPTLSNCRSPRSIGYVVRSDGNHWSAIEIDPLEFIPLKFRCRLARHIPSFSCVQPNTPNRDVRLYSPLFYIHTQHLFSKFIEFRLLFLSIGPPAPRYAFLTTEASHKLRASAGCCCRASPEFHPTFYFPDQ